MADGAGGVLAPPPRSFVGWVDEFRLGVLGSVLAGISFAGDGILLFLGLIKVSFLGSQIKRRAVCRPLDERDGLFIFCFCGCLVAVASCLLGSLRWVPTVNFSGLVICGFPCLSDANGI